MEHTLEVIDRNVQDLFPEVKVIQDTLLQLGEQTKSTSNQLSEILMKLNTPLAHDVPLQRLIGQSDTASVSSAYSNNTEDDIIRDTGFKTKCMASSIQSWFYDIIKKIAFHAVNDEAQEKGIITPEAHEKFRKAEDEDNGKRMLIISVMDKSCDTMVSFVDIIGRLNEDLKDSIMSTFDDRWKTETMELKEECIQCLIKRRCDLVSLCTFYFTHDFISRELLNIVIHCAPHDRSIYWSRFQTEVSSGEDGYALSLMRSYLTEDDQYDFHSDIVKQIDRDLKRGKRSFICRCHPRMKRPTPVNYELFNRSPSSLNTSPVSISPGAYNKRRRFQSNRVTRGTDPNPPIFQKMSP